MDESLWRHTVVLLLVLHMPSRFRDMDKQEFGGHRCEKKFIKNPALQKTEQEAKHRNSLNWAVPFKFEEIYREQKIRKKQVGEGNRCNLECTWLKSN